MRNDEHLLAATVPDQHAEEQIRPRAEVRLALEPLVKSRMRLTPYVLGPIHVNKSTSNDVAPTGHMDAVIGISIDVNDVKGIAFAPRIQRRHVCD